MKTTRKLLSLVLAIILCMGLAAPAFADDGGELTVWFEKVYSDDANNYIQEVINKFAEESGVKVNLELINATDFVTRMNAAVEADAMPDISIADVRRVLNYYPENPYMDVTDLVNEINETMPFMQSVYDISQVDGKFYFVPFDSSANLMFIRKDKMEEAGVTEVPKTWDEMFDLAAKMSDPDNEFYGLGMTMGAEDNEAEDTMRVILWNYGGGLFNDDGSPNATNEVNQDIFGRFLDMYQNGVLPEAAISWGPADNNGSYLLGSVGIVVNACTLYTAMRDNPDYAELLENTIVTKCPTGPDNGKQMAFLYGWAVHDTCENVDAAYDLLHYIYSEDVYTDYLNQIAPVYAPVFENVAAQVYNAHTFSNALNALAAGDVTVEEALQRIDDAIIETTETVIG